AARARGDPGLAQVDVQRLVPKHALERAQLLVDDRERVELGVDELLTGALETMQVEDEAAEVAEAELAHAAQVRQAAAQPPAIAEARGARDLHRGGVEVCRRRDGRLLRGHLRGRRSDERRAVCPGR